MANKTQGRTGRASNQGQRVGQRKAAGREENTDEGALTLSEVAIRTGISMPTLQRYKKLYQSRIPSVGKGRTQRYPAESLAVFEELKKENIGRRGRPRKDASAAAAPAPAARSGLKPGRLFGPRSLSNAGDSGYLTLTSIAEQTGISYPTLVRYSKVHSNELPSRGTGRARRYAPEAVAVFRRLRGESPRGRRPKNAPAPAFSAPRGGRISWPEPVVRGGADAGVLARLQSIERAQAALDRQLRELIKLISKPLRITIDRR